MPRLDSLLFLLTGQPSHVLPDSMSDALLLTLILVAAFFLPRARLAFLRPAENLWIRLARREGLAIALTGVLALGVNAVISLCGRIPIPAVQDEFSYLLAADTFAQGRFSNPTPPNWIPFETFHVIFQPTYASKYPPGQGLMLAIGQVLTGYAFVGSWLGTAFACMALCWMLYRWVPPRWALLGGLLASVHPVMIFWTQTYWGCQWVVAGSALALGGLRIFLDQRAQRTSYSARCGWIIGVGMSLMLLTRPYEGGVLCLLILITIAIAVFKTRRIFLRQSLHQIAPVFGLLLLTIGAQGYYNFRVTGDARVLPYAVHEKTYGLAPLFIWQDFKTPPHYNHRVIRNFHILDETPEYMSNKSPALWLGVFGDKVSRFAALHCQLLACALGLLAWPWLFGRNRRLRLVSVLLVLMMGAIAVEVWMLQHYTTPLVALGLILSMSGLRLMRSWRWHGRHCGLFLTRATIVLSFLSVVSSYAQIADAGGEGIVYGAPGLRQFAAARQKVLEKLRALPGRHLVIVSYSARHDTSQEWVQNGADIESAKVAWARAMSPVQNQTLAEYFKQRSSAIWLLEADEKPPRLRRFLLAVR